MSAYNQTGNLAWIGNKVGEIKNSVDIYNATKTNEAALNIAAKLGELAWCLRIFGTKEEKNIYICLNA